MPAFIRLFCVLLVLSAIRINANAQELPVKQITQVVVESNKKFFSEDHTSLCVHMNTIQGLHHEHIGTILEKNSPALIRQYGAAGSLVSVSLHGTGSNHTQITWNGIPLNSPTTGQADLSLIPAAFMQTVEIINGASGSVFGSGTFGGAVNLTNEPDWKNRLSLNYSVHAGSYGLRGHLVSLKTGNQHLQYQFSAVTSRSDNNFTYRDQYKYNAPPVENTHNTYRDLGILQNLYVNLRKAGYLETGVWIQYKDLEIPALMGSYTASHARQKDSLFRSFISYLKTGNNFSLNVKSAYFSDYLNYTDKINSTDPGYSLDSRITAKRMMNDANARIYITSRLIAGAGFSYNRMEGKSNNFGGKINENEYAVYGNLKAVYKSLIINVGLRKEFYEGLNPQAQYSLGFRYKINDHFLLRSTFSNKFRKPTFNEKYWKPGGNVNLKPEKGRGGEITIEWNILGTKLDPVWISSRVSGFYQTVDNWIQWVILDSLTPVEYKNVHSSGLETWINYGFTFGFLAIKGQFNYNFNRSVITATFEDHQQYEGNQLIYVPRNTFRASADAEFHDMFAGISCAYTGWRETTETADRDLRLPAFFIADCMVGYHRDEGRIPWGAYFRVDNLFDQSFQVIRSFPLPGRTYHISLTMGLTKKES